MEKLGSILAILLLIYTSGKSCYNKPQTRTSNPTKPATKKVEPEEENLTPDEIELRAKGDWTTGLAYEQKFYETGKRYPEYAIIAIKNFLSYYNFAQNGKYACIALIRSCELYYHIKQKERAIQILNHIKSRRDFLIEYRTLIKRLEELLGT